MKTTMTPYTREKSQYIVIQFSYYTMEGISSNPNKIS